MSIKTYEFYEVGDEFDAEGRGPFKVIGRFWNEDQATQWSIKRGNYGKDARVNKVAIAIADRCDDMESYRQEEIRQKALKKLTDDEKKALGLM